MKTILTALLVINLGFISLAAEPSTEESTLTKVGQPAPAFTVSTLDGQTLDLTDLKGKVVLINFLATWCGPCLAELPHLEKEVWQKFRDKEFVLMAIGREHKNSELVPFKQKHKLSFPIAGDPKREVYEKYATQYIPRNILIGKDGKILFQAVGFEESEFKKMVQMIEKSL